MRMVRPLVGLVQREVLLDHTTAQHHRCQRHHMTGRMVGITRQTVERTLIGLQHVHVRAVDLRGIVRDALHEHEILVARLLDGAHGLVDLRHRRVAGSQHHGDALAGGVVEHLEPRDLTRTDLDERQLHVGAEVDGLLEIGRGGEVDAHLRTVVGDLLVPLDGELHIAEHLRHRTAPRTMNAVKGHLRETTLRDDALGLECLELGAVSTCLLRGVDQALGLVETAVEVTADLGDEISGIVRTDHPVPDLNVLVKIQHTLFCLFTVYSLRFTVDYFYSQNGLPAYHL